MGFITNILKRIFSSSSNINIGNKESKQEINIGNNAQNQDIKIGDIKINEK